MTNTRNKNKSSKSKTRKNGGSVLASGGFGCVFSPGLLCKGQTKRKRNTVSKLMTTRHAREEYNEITNIHKHVNSIPNYKDYFLVDDISICTPKKLTASDLTNFKKTCTALPKDGITLANINTSIDRVMSLNLPNGGMDVDDYIFKNGGFNKILNLNIKLIDLLNNGILEMNKQHIYHSDIKGSNILIDNSLKTRLIDWGLSTEYTPFKKKPIPSTWYNRPLQFNVPFSVILFTKLFKTKYNAYLKNGGKLERDSLRLFVGDYIQEWKKVRGIGHYKVINDIMYMLFSNDLKIKQSLKWVTVEKKYTIPYIINYLVEILIHYTQTDADDVTEYLDKVFVKIVDVWGFLSVYTTIIELLFNNYSILNENEQKLFQSLKKVILEYMYAPTVNPPNITKLTNDLTNLNAIFIVNKDIIVHNEINTSSKISFKRISKRERRKQPVLVISKDVIHEVFNKYV